MASHVLRHPGARSLFVGQLLSQVCDKMMSVGLVWLFTERYPATAIPWFLAISALPHLLLARHSARAITRLGLVRTLAGADLFRGLLFIVLAAAWKQVPPAAELTVLFGVSFLANIAGAMFNPAIMSAPVTVVDGTLVQQLTALLESCFSVGAVAGPLLSALLYPTIGLSGLFWLNGASYVVAAAFDSVVRSTAPTSDGEVAAERVSDPLIVALLGGFLASNLFLSPVMVLMPLFVRACYHQGLSTLAGLEIALGVGTMVGGAVLSSIRPGRMAARLTVGMVGVAASYLAFSLSTTSTSGYVCLTLLGVCLAATNVMSLTLFQTRPPAHQVPAVMSMVNVISVAALPVSMVIVAVLVPLYNVRSIAVACAAGLLVCTALLLLRRDVRSLS